MFSHIRGIGESYRHRVVVVDVWIGELFFLRGVEACD